VSAVRIDVLGRAELLGTAFTTADGVAELSFERWSEARRLTLTHLGFQTLIVHALRRVRGRALAAEVKGARVSREPSIEIGVRNEQDQEYPDRDTRDDA
jgi:hypothetical protein